LSTKKRLYIKTYGCQMNVYDSGRMADLLAPLGYRPTETPEDADMVILNTCHIREKAAEKVYSDLGRLRQHQEAKAAAGGRQLIAVAGCVAQAEGEEILRRAPQVDMVVGPQTYHRLPQMIAEVERRGDARADGGGPRPGRGVLDTDFPEEDKFDHLPEESAPQGWSAFLSIQEGCDKFCSFCVVPYTRGAEYSRPAADVLAEARRLVAQGTREITLLGQNVNAYHGEAPDGRGEWGLGRLCRALAEIEGLARIRYTTSHPRDVDDELIAAHRDVPELMPFLHLPVQSGSDRILKAMNRRHTADDYRRIVDRLRTANPDLAMASDFIVGFPGETEEDHAESLRLIEDIGFAYSFSFKYSPRPGTPAATLGRAVPEPDKDARLHELQRRLEAQHAAFNRACVGRSVPVLLERRGKRAGQLVGRSPWMQGVHVEAPERLLGTLAEVELAEARTNSLQGRLVGATFRGASDRDGARAVERDTRESTAA
jgi:tRNA-2-methylthio-N6-dimethylallyladenosine synthase